VTFRPKFTHLIWKVLGHVLSLGVSECNAT
jgi:hypothetical protein